MLSLFIVFMTFIRRRKIPFRDHDCLGFHVLLQGAENDLKTFKIQAFSQKLKAKIIILDCKEVRNPAQLDFWIFYYLIP